MADTLAQVQKDVRFWQRLLTFAGYKPGKVDGVNGRNTKAAAQEWQNDAERIKAEIGSVEKNICQILFKLAVESAMLSNLEAIQVQVSDAQMQQLRKTCSRFVAENNGIIKFEEAYEYQHR